MIKWDRVKMAYDLVSSNECGKMEIACKSEDGTRIEEEIKVYSMGKKNPVTRIDIKRLGDSE